MFQKIEHLAQEMVHMTNVVESKHNPELQDRVRLFVIDVNKEVNLAFSDVHQILGEIAFLPPSEVNEDKMMEFQRRLVDTYARDKFKNVHHICDRLNILAEGYRTQIEPYIRTEYPNSSSSQLFWLLEKHEGAFIYTIKHAVDEITQRLDSVENENDFKEIRLKAKQAQRELRSALDKITNLANTYRANLSGGTSDLLDTKEIANNILKNSPIISLSCYLGVTIVLLTAFTIVAGTTSLKSFIVITMATYVGLVIIGAFQLRNDNKLKEENFMKLIELALLRVFLPFSKLFAGTSKKASSSR